MTGVKRRCAAASEIRKVLDMFEITLLTMSVSDVRKAMRLADIHPAKKRSPIENLKSAVLDRLKKYLFG